MHKVHLTAQCAVRRILLQLLFATKLRFCKLGCEAAPEAMPAKQCLHVPSQLMAAVCGALASGRLLCVVLEPRDGCCVWCTSPGTAAVCGALAPGLLLCVVL